MRKKSWGLTFAAILALLPSPSWAQNQLILEWDDRSSDEDGFRIERGTAIAGPFTQFATVGANVIT